MFGGMKLLATFDRDKERNLWFPILANHGFSRLETSADIIDHENAIDAVGYDNVGNQKLFALRVRDEGSYSDSRLARYKREFTIRYARPSGEPVEWQKLFEMNLDLLPDYFCYGWRKKSTNLIEDYVVLDVPTLQLLYKEGKLSRYEANKRVNVNSRMSTLVFIPLPELLKMQSADNLIVYHSDNHPALS